MENSIETALSYMLDCPKPSLASFRFSQLNRSVLKEKIAREAINEAVQARALALLAEWIELYGEAIVAGGMADAA